MEDFKSFLKKAREIERGINSNILDIQARRYIEQPTDNVSDNKRLEYIASHIEKISHMTLEEFGKVDLIVKVASKILQEDFYLVSNSKLVKEIKDKKLTIYLPREVKYIYKIKPNPESLKKIHLIKKIFGGNIVDNRNADDR